MEYVAGGELYDIIQNRGHLSEDAYIFILLYLLIKLNGKKRVNITDCA